LVLARVSGVELPAEEESVLDLDSLVGDIKAHADEVAASADETRRQREAAVAQLRVAAGLQDLRKAVDDFGQDLAVPIQDRDLTATYLAPPAEDYTVIAADGSQIAPDFHHVAPWYVINTGCAVFRYGAPSGRSRCRLTSHPDLKPPQRARATLLDDDGVGHSDARAVSVSQPGPLEAERLLAELQLSAELLESEADAGRTVLLLDGPLVQWRMITQIANLEERDRIIAAFSGLLRRARELEVPVAGYISRSRAIEWITLLRFTLCPEVAKLGAPCTACAALLLKSFTTPSHVAHHGSLAGLRDVELAGELLYERGARSQVLELKSRVWTRISGGDQGAAGFFYLNTGTEIGRVELPQWVWEDDDHMERLHSVLWDQCEAGSGYPMVLAEAHEAAVIRGADRSAFYHVIERVLSERGIPVAATSAKAASKRRPMA
jgi:hypothetical protein